MKLASRVNNIEPFHVMKLLARARKLESEGKNIIHMEIGEPDFITPQPILNAAQNAIEQGKVHYCPALGLPELRQAIADYYLSQYGLKIRDKRVVITTGASAALLLIFGLLVEPGSKVMMCDPGYPCNKHFAEFVNASARMVPVNAATNFQLTAELLQQYWQPDVSTVLLASPSNPTGSVISQSEMIAISDFVTSKNMNLIVDEIYQGLYYGSDSGIESILSINDKAFVVNSFSKSFNMTGWRLGWIIAPDNDHVITSLDNLSQNLYLAAPTIAQYAALAAFDSETSEILEQRRQVFETRRNYLFTALNELGFKITQKPQGAFYIYADCSQFSDNSAAFCNEILEQAGVAITPGIDFGFFNAQQYVRFAYTTSMENLVEGIHRLSVYLK